MIFTADLRRDLNGLWDMKHQGKPLDQGWNKDDLDYFVLLCKSFALHVCFFPIIYDIYCGGGGELILH